MLGGLREAHPQSPQVRARVEAVREYLEANMTKDLDMASVARAAPQPLRLHPDLQGPVRCAPYRYLIRLRINYAAELLRTSMLTVTQICHRVGFNSLSHFITTFRRHVGASPMQYRRMLEWPQDHNRFGSETEALLKGPRRRDV